MKTIRQSVIKTSAYTVLLTALFALLSWSKTPANELILAIPYFIILYFIFFAIGKPVIVDWLQKKLGNYVKKVLLFPMTLVVLFYSYLALNGSNPLKGTTFLVPYLLLFPILAFAARDHAKKEIDWFDFTIFFLYFLPVTLVKVSPDGNLPFSGGGFDSVYRIIIMLAAVFAFAVVRNIKDIGAYPVFKWRYLFTTLWVWAAFYGFVFLIGYSVNFIDPGTIPPLDGQQAEAIVRKLISVFLHTALFEELVFRGLLQNMLQKRISQNRSWKSFWWWGIIILMLLSLITGYSMKGALQWFPAAISLLLFMAAWWLEASGKHTMGVYTALVITSVIFGLVHFHSGSIIFTGLASIGGWAYGYVYLKTKNIFYASLLHALVNTSPLIFGLELAK